MLVAPGRLMQARRGGWRPSALGALLIDDWDPARADLMTLAGAAVSAWTSAKAGQTLAQAVGASRPLWSATGFAGLAPGVTFDGLDDELTMAAIGNLPTGATPSEVWMLVDQKAAAADATTRVLATWGGNASNNVRRRLDRTVVAGVNRANHQAGTGATSVTATNTAAAFSGPGVLRGRLTATDMRLDLNGAAGAASAIVPAVGTTNLRVGAINSATASLFANATVGRLIFTALLDDAQAALMTAYLKRLGGIA